MPTYTIRNKSTGEEQDMFFTSYTAKEEFLNANPEMDSIIRRAPALHSGEGLGLRRVDAGFKDVLDKIKQGSPGNNINVPSHKATI